MLTRTWTWTHVAVDVDIDVHMALWKSSSFDQIHVTHTFHRAKKQMENSETRTRNAQKWSQCHDDFECQVLFGTCDCGERGHVAMFESTFVIVLSRIERAEVNSRISTIQFKHQSVHVHILTFVSIVNGSGGHPAKV